MSRAETVPLIGRPAPADWKHLRERHGLTQQELADLVHRGVDTVRKWEQDKQGREGDVACWHLALLLLGEVAPPPRLRRRG